MKNIFISFATADTFARDELVRHSIQGYTQYYFDDKSLYKPLSGNWKIKCRVKINQCNGLIAIISDNTFNAEGARYEIWCAYQDGIPVLPIYYYKTGTQFPISQLEGQIIYPWKWKIITDFIKEC